MTLKYFTECRTLCGYRLAILWDIHTVRAVLQPWFRRQSRCRWWFPALGLFYGRGLSRYLVQACLLDAVGCEGGQLALPGYTKKTAGEQVGVWWGAAQLVVLIAPCSCQGVCVHGCAGTSGVSGTHSAGTQPACCAHVIRPSRAACAGARSQSSCTPLKDLSDLLIMLVGRVLMTAVCDCLLSPKREVWCWHCKMWSRPNAAQSAAMCQCDGGMCHVLLTVVSKCRVLLRYRLGPCLSSVTA